MHAGEDKRLDMDNAKNMSWTGASHWRYRTGATGMGMGAGQVGASAAQTGNGSKRSQASKSSNVPEPLDFTILLDMDDPPRIELEKSKRRKRAEPKSTAPDDSKTLLPEDYKYAVSTLGKYNLRREYISILYSGPRAVGSRGRDGGTEGGALDGDNDDDDGFAYGPSELDAAFDSTINGGGINGGVDGGVDGGDDWTVDNGGSVELAQAAHKVEQVEVSYCKAAKQVDVKSLKELMWRGISIVAGDRAAKGLDNPRDDIRFADVLATVPADNHAGRLEDLSVHLCFICVLHLANEHGLVVKGVDSLDGLLISNVPVDDEGKAVAVA